MLGYHHYLTRTLPLLFPPEHMYFWGNVLCQEAWGSEYVHLTLTALGNLHRAVIMMAACEETVQQAGLNEKLSAVQQYTQALQELAHHLDDARSVPKALVGALCLMAYFEVSLRIAMVRVANPDSPDCTPDIQRQSACVCWTFEGCHLLFTEHFVIAWCHRCWV